MFVGEYFDGERRLDMILRASKWDSPGGAGGDAGRDPDRQRACPSGELVRVESTVGAGGLRRVDGHRTIGLNVSPPKELSLGQAIELLKRDVEPADPRRRCRPTARCTTRAMRVHCAKRLSNMAQNLAIALIALFLLLAALFRSVKDSLYVILTIPLASFGGVLALVLLRLFTPQTLDLLTMVGFVVLMGLVVNNAILLVDQARNEIRAGATVRAAVESALATRTRPIMLTTLTTLFGMLPLVLVPGPGSVLYRGLGTVLVGGMAVNSVFTLVLLPTLLRLIEKPDARDRGRSPTNNPWKPYETHPRLYRLVSALAAARHRAADAPPVPVVVTTARSENFGASLAATGTVVSRNDARISTEVGGTARLDRRARHGGASAAKPSRASTPSVSRSRCVTTRPRSSGSKRSSRCWPRNARGCRRWATSCRRASWKRPCRASAWQNRTWSRRASRGIARGSI